MKPIKYISTILLISTILFFSCEKETTPSLRKLDYKTDTRFNVLYFIDEMTGFAGGGDDGTSSLLIKTTDGGKNWTYIDFISESPINEIQFLDYNTGFISDNSGRLFKSTDGGINWTELCNFAPYAIMKFSIITENKIYAIVSIYESTLYHNIYKLVSTTDGNKWDTLLNSRTSQSYLNNIQFLKDNPSIVYLSTSYEIYKSTDEGKSWMRIYMGNRFNSFYFSNENSLFIAENDGIKISTDGGRTFTFKELIGCNEVIMQNSNDGVVRTSYLRGELHITHDAFQSMHSIGNWEIEPHVFAFPTINIGYFSDFRGNLYKYQVE